VSANTEQRKLAAIMFTDMVGYSALSQRNEQLAQELIEEHRALLRPLFACFNGTEIKTIGDAFLIEFHSALEAAQCGIEIQRALAKRNHDVPNDRRVEIKIGIHIGDVVHRGGDVYGDGVNIASRIEPLAGAGGICVSMDVERQIRNALEARFEKLAPTELKNISVAMDLFRIVLPWETPAKAAASASGRASPIGRWAGVAILLLLAAGVGWWFVHQSGQATKQVASSPTAPGSELKSIAVLPFVSMSADKADEYLSDGMTEELLNVLAQVPGLHVPGRSSCFAFKGKNEEGIFRKVGEQLHVTTVLEGSVRKAGDKLRITAQLINVADGFHLWSTNYDRDMKDILAVQTEVAQQVVQVLQVKLGVEAARALAKAPTGNPEAHRLYLLGRYHFGKATQAGWFDAIQAFNQAIQLDPGYALAYCGLADNYGFLGGSFMPGKEAWAKEKDAAQKAVSLDPNLADAHLSLALALACDFDWPGMDREMKRALELNPNLALARDQFAWLLTVQGRFDEAVAQSRKAVELDPLSPLININLAEWLLCARRFDDAIAQARKTLALDPNYAWALRTLGWSLRWKGDTAGALAETTDVGRWSVWSQCPTDFSVTLDPAVTRNGHPALRIAYVSSEPPEKYSFVWWGKHHYDLDTFRKYLGHTVRMSVWAKSEDVLPRAGLDFQPKDLNGKRLKTLRSTDRILGTTDWREYSIICDIPEETKDFQTAVFMYGNGKLWVDTNSFKWEIVGTLPPAKQLTPASQHITQPGDLIFASSGNSRGSEGAANAIDNDKNTKYLNWDSGRDGNQIGTFSPSGFAVQPAVGPTVVTGMGIQSANDASDRDPDVVVLEGSNDTNLTSYESGTWTPITTISNIAAGFTARFQSQELFFTNTSPYRNYRWRVEATRIMPNRCCMQVAEVWLTGSAPLNQAKSPTAAGLSR